MPFIDIQRPVNWVSNTKHSAAHADRHTYTRTYAASQT